MEKRLEISNHQEEQAENRVGILLFKRTDILQICAISSLCLGASFAIAQWLLRH